MIWVYRVDENCAKDGTATRTVYRRQLLSQGKDTLELGPVERCVVPRGTRTEPDWKAASGLLGRGTHLSWARYAACGYTRTPPKEIR